MKLVRDLSGDAFLNSLKIFISRRNLCQTIYSDNATNFIGANDLKNLHHILSDVDKYPNFREFINQNQITWNQQNRAKYSLKRLLGDAYLTFE